MKKLFLVRRGLRQKYFTHLCRHCGKNFKSWFAPTYSPENPKILITDRCELCYYKPEEEFFDRHRPQEDRNWIPL